ncbi:MAG TPA: transglutaminase domain-containing protein [Burkholderiales bacterium]|nr:transglutaminase domain-containing protein [Burkholderiales bacterium]
MNRRSFLKQGLGLSAGLYATGLPAPPRRALAAEMKWRSFEVITRVEPADPSSVTRAWIPVPLMSETSYFRRLGDTWTGNAPVSRLARDEKYDAGFVHAEWPGTEKAPVIEITSRFSTRDRFVDVTKPPTRAPREDAAILRTYLEPTTLIPTDGIVLETAQKIVKGQTTELAKARAIYEWIVDNTFRDPKVKGCGLGDVKTMLETRYLGGKCADLNALYVGLARAAGLPARDVYGVRCADSADFKSLGKGGDISKAQHCRAEVFLNGYGWVPVDPADVRKVVLEEKPQPTTLADPVVPPVRQKLFGAWEMNWLAFNTAHDVALPGSKGPKVGFFMYPQLETANGRADPLDPDNFKYTITAREIKA